MIQVLATMICHSRSMQISGATLLFSQQAAAAQPAAPGFSAALQKAGGFQPRELSKPEPVAEAKPAPQPGPARPGMHIDIKI
jgi:hypothetical protein